MDTTTPKIVGPTMLGVVASVARSSRKFDWFQTLRNNSQHIQQHATGCPNGLNM